MDDTTQIEQSGEPIGLARRLDGVVLGALVGFTETGVPLVDFPGNPQDNPVSARSTAELSPDDIGREVALLFEEANPSKPILIGPIVSLGPQAARRFSVDRDGERLELSAQREVVLRCGNASITLTRAGKILIRGDYVSSHSRGVNKIKGGVVHIN
jgi:uncharacterized protein DUF6484